MRFRVRLIVRSAKILIIRSAIVRILSKYRRGDCGGKNYRST
jgi:hypothetical protein